MNKRLRAVWFLLFGVSVFVSPALAQRRVAHSPGRRASPAFSRAHRFRGDAAFPPYFYPDYYYPDYDYQDYGYPDDSLAPQAAEAPSAAQPSQPVSSAPAQRPPESLVLELRGDHWVRITNHGASLSAESAQPEWDQTSESSGGSRSRLRHNQAPRPSGELPSATLVFRDGHQEKIQKYVIVDQTIYAGAEHWRGGLWNRKIQVAELDVPATLALNQERGTKFNLPSAPNEVIVRP